MLFLQIGEGVDDATWLHHLHAGDYSRWLREAIKDTELADDVLAVEADTGLLPNASRARIRSAVEARYHCPPDRHVRRPQDDDSTSGGAMVCCCPSAMGAVPAGPVRRSKSSP